MHDDLMMKMRDVDTIVGPNLDELHALLATHRRRYGIPAAEATLSPAALENLVGNRLMADIKSGIKHIRNELTAQLREQTVAGDDYLARTYLRQPKFMTLPDVLTNMGKDELRGLWQRELERAFAGLVKFKRVTDGHSIYYGQLMAYVR